MAIKILNLSPKGERRFISEQLLSDRWGVPITTLQKWRQNGYGPVFAKFSAKVVYPIASVEEFERSSLRQSTSEKV